MDSASTLSKFIFEGYMKSTIFVLSVALAMTGCQEKANEPTSVSEPAAIVEPAASPATTPAAAMLPANEALVLVCFLDEIDGVASQPMTEVATGAMTKFRGWIGYLNGQGISPEVFELKLVSEAQTYAFKQAAGGLRQDVADSQAKPGLLNAGYEFIQAMSGVAPGTYEINMSTKNNGVESSCTTGKLITVK